MSEDNDRPSQEFIKFVRKLLYDITKEIGYAPETKLLRDGPHYLLVEHRLNGCRVTIGWGMFN